MNIGVGCTSCDEVSISGRPGQITESRTKTGQHARELTTPISLDHRLVKEKALTQ